MTEKGFMNSHMNDNGQYDRISRDIEGLKRSLSHPASENISRMNNSSSSANISHDAIANPQNLDTVFNKVVDTPGRINALEKPSVPSSSTRHYLTPGPVFTEENTWNNPTVKRSYSDSLQSRDSGSIGVNRNLDYTFQEGVQSDSLNGTITADFPITNDRTRILSPVDKVRDSPDFVSLVSQILQSSQSTGVVSTNHSSSSTWNLGEEMTSIPAIQYSQFEPVVSVPGSPPRRSEFMSRSADQALPNQHLSQQPVYRSYGHGHIHPHITDETKQYATYSQGLQQAKTNSYSLSNPVFERHPQYGDGEQHFNAYNPLQNMNYVSVSHPPSRRGSGNYDITSGPTHSITRSDIDRYPTSSEASILPEHSISSAWASINSVVASVPYNQEFQRSQRYSSDSFENSEYKPSYSLVEPAQPPYDSLGSSRHVFKSETTNLTMQSSSSGFPSRSSFDNEFNASHNLAMPQQSSHTPYLRGGQFYQQENGSPLQDDYLSYRTVRPQESLYHSSMSSRGIINDASNNSSYSNLPQSGYRSTGYRNYSDDLNVQQHQSINSAFTLMQVSNGNIGSLQNSMILNVVQRSNQNVAQTFTHPPSIPSSNVSSMDASATSASQRSTRRTTPTGPQLYRPNSSMPPTPPSSSPSVTRSSDGSIARTKSMSLAVPEAPQLSTSPGSGPTRPQQHSELVESPRTKHIFKEFYRVFRIKERESLESARAYAKEFLNSVPEKTKWKIYLELAEICKRNNEFDEARRLYEKVTKLQPLASQGWLEWSKMEEEFGCFEQSLIILQDGLRYCQYNEGLLTKAVKQHERRDENNLARQMLSGLLHESVDRVWRSILEGALFEVRSGEFAAARKIFKFLMQHVSWYGPIYFEAYRLDEKESDYENALKIIHKGLSELPRYGPLWFGLLRIMERYDVQAEEGLWLAGNRPKLMNSRGEIINAVKSISPELIWKLHFEQAQVEERAADAAAHGLCASSTVYLSTSLYAIRHKLFNFARVSLIRSLLVCPSNLKWKVWLAGCRLELSTGKLVAARRALCLAFSHVPIKSKAYVYLEATRLEEYCGNIAAARRMLQLAMNEISNEWKLHLESVLLEARAGYLIHATHIAEMGLKQHSGTGRLWAVLIQLCHRLESVTSKKFCEESSSISISKHLSNETDEDIDEEIHGIMVSSDNSTNYKLPNKFVTFARAIFHVPKSGEVWCEGARCVMNPMNVTSFDLSLAQKYLAFAIQFTPQYGDAFIEYIRFEMLTQVLLPRILLALGINMNDFYQLFLSHDPESDTADFPTFGRSQSQSAASVPLEDADNRTSISYQKIFHQQYRRQLLISLEKMSSVDENVISKPSDLLQQYRNIVINKLNRRCSNADPNYGTLWFHSRIHSFDSSYEILQHAVEHISQELTGCSAIYARAILHYVEKSIRDNVLHLLRSTNPQIDQWLLSTSSTTTESSTLDLEEARFMNYVTFLKDFDLAKRLWGDWRNSVIYRKCLSIVDLNGSIYIATDFVTSMIDLNRLLFKKKLSDEERRKLLFCFDQILS